MRTYLSRSDTYTHLKVANTDAQHVLYVRTSIHISQTHMLTFTHVHTYVYNYVRTYTHYNTSTNKPSITKPSSTS